MSFESINYITSPLSVSQLKDLLRRAELRPHEALRTKEPAYQQYVAGKNRSDNQLLELMVTHPELLQRPLVVRNGKAVLARPVANLERLGIK